MDRKSRLSPIPPAGQGTAAVREPAGCGEGWREAPSVAEFHRRQWPSLSPCRKRQAVQHLARFLAEAHRAGRRHRRLSADNLKVRPVSIGWEFLFTGRSTAFPFPFRFGKRGRILELSALYAGLLPSTSRAAALRFLRAYLPEAGRDERRRWIRAVEKRAISLARGRWQRQRRRPLGNNQDFATGKNGGFSVFRRRDAIAAEALAVLLPDPDVLLRQGEIMPGRGNSCLAAKVRIAGRPYVLKRYDCRGWTYRLRHIFRRSRALRTWIAAWSFRQLGFPLPEPCLCLEERRFRLLERSYILTEFFEGSSRLSDVYPQQSPRWRRALLARLGVVLGRLHRFQGIHGDTNWDNILVRPEGSDIPLVLVDLDGSRVLRWGRPARLAKDVWHVVRDLRRRGGDRQEEITFFLRCWRRWSGNREAVFHLGER